MNKGKYAYMGLSLKYALESSGVSKIHRVVKKPEYTSFRVPIHFATNCFTFEKTPPPPPQLTLTKRLKAVF